MGAALAILLLTRLPNRFVTAAVAWGWPALRQGGRHGDVCGLGMHRDAGVAHVSNPRQSPSNPAPPAVKGNRSKTCGCTLVVYRAIYAIVVVRAIAVAGNASGMCLTAPVQAAM